MCLVQFCNIVLVWWWFRITIMEWSTSLFRTTAHKWRKSSGQSPNRFPRILDRFWWWRYHLPLGENGNCRTGDYVGWMGFHLWLHFHVGTDCSSHCDIKTNHASITQLLNPSNTPPEHLEPTRATSNKRLDKSMLQCFKQSRTRSCKIWNNQFGSWASFTYQFRITIGSHMSL